jgi:hypothetical protein
MCWRNAAARIDSPAAASNCWPLGWTVTLCAPELIS